MKTERYFIFDCNGEVVGNPKGYRTHHGAWCQVEGRGRSIGNLVWTRFYARKRENKSVVYSIKLLPLSSDMV